MKKLEVEVPWCQRSPRGKAHDLGMPSCSTHNVCKLKILCVRGCKSYWALMCRRVKFLSSCGDCNFPGVKKSLSKRKFFMFHMCV